MLIAVHSSKCHWFTRSMEVWSLWAMERKYQLLYHCFVCRFYSCVTCCSEATEPGLPNPIYLSHPLTPNQLPTPFHIPPVETHQKEPNESLESIPKSEKCKICFEKRAVAAFLHDRTGHTCTCMMCAYTIFHTDGQCPIWRKPVSGVIANSTLWYFFDSDDVYQ